jgi:hypothetical protein
MNMTKPTCLALVILTAFMVSGCTVTGSSNSKSDGSTTTGVLFDHNCGALNSNALNSSASVNLTSTSKWSCCSTRRTLAGDGVSDHEGRQLPKCEQTSKPRVVQRLERSRELQLSTQPRACPLLNTRA